MGPPLSVYVTPADVQDWAGARLLLAGLKPLAPRLKKIRADGAYSGKELARWREEQGRRELEIVERNRGTSAVLRSCRNDLRREDIGMAA